MSEVRINVPEDSEVIVVPKGRRVVTVPVWLPRGWGWRGAVIIALLVTALVIGNIVAWPIQASWSCDARRNGTLDVARAVDKAADNEPAFAVDSGVNEGLHKVARYIRRTAEEC